MRLINSFTALRELAIYWEQGLTELLRSLQSCGQTLESLVFVGPVDARGVSYLPVALPNLQAFVFDSDTTDIDVDELLSLNRVRKLRRLGLWSVSVSEEKDKDPTFVLDLDFLRGLALEQLLLPQLRVDPAQLTALFPQLQLLHLPRWPPGADLRPLAALPLTRLSICLSRADELRSLRGVPLRHLKLWPNGSEFVSWTLMAADVLRVLVELGLPLELLELWFPCVPDDFALVPALTSLSELYIRDASLREQPSATAEALARLPRCSLRTVRISVSSTNVNVLERPVRRALRERNPHLRVDMSPSFSDPMEYMLRNNCPPPDYYLFEVQTARL